MEGHEPHAAARVCRYLVVVTDDPDPPRLPRDRVPTGSRFVVLGDGKSPPRWADVQAAAAGFRAELGAAGWVWIGHDQFFYRTEWTFHACFGPPGWESDRLAASTASAERVVRLAQERRDAERAASAERVKSQRGKPRGKRAPRNLDAIVEQTGGDDW